MDNIYWINGKPHYKDDEGEYIELIPTTEDDCLYGSY